MRIWSIHPGYLDSKGLVALWREALLAQKVLLGKTKGYKSHPQLLRFRNTKNPTGAISDYLKHIADEADKRNYKFDRNKIYSSNFQGVITVTDEQLFYEFKHLLVKLKNRDKISYKRLKDIKTIKSHPIFEIINGGIENWEIIR